MEITTVSEPPRKGWKVTNDERENTVWIFLLDIGARGGERGEGAK